MKKTVKKTTDKRWRSWLGKILGFLVGTRDKDHMEDAQDKSENGLRDSNEVGLNKENSGVEEVATEQDVDASIGIVVSDWSDSNEAKGDALRVQEVLEASNADYPRDESTGSQNSHSVEEEKDKLLGASKSAAEVTDTFDKPPLDKDKGNFCFKLSFTIELQKCKREDGFKALDDFLKVLSRTSLQNGNVGKPYEGVFDFSACHLFRSANSLKLNIKVDHEGWNEIGLSPNFIRQTGILEIEGVPTSDYDGDVQIDVDFSVKEMISPVVDEGLQGTCSCVFSYRKKFSINPDPWDLWQNLPSQGSDYVKPDSDFGSATLCASPQITFLCASQRGRSHAQESKFRDDHFQFYFPEKDALTLVALPPEGEAASLEKEPTRTDEPGPSPDRWNFIAVADGAGSAKFSREGSRIACTKMIDSFRTDFFDKFSDKLDAAILGALPESGSICKEIPGTEVVVGADQSGAKHTVASFCARAVWNVYEKIRARALEYNEQASADFQNATSELDTLAQATPKQNAELRDYSTTLLFAAVKRFPATETRKQFWAIIAYWVGDGGLAIYRPNGRDKVLTLGKPDGGEYAGQTRFITTRDEIEPTAVANRVKIALVEDFKALVLMTDGLTDPFFPAESDLGKIEFWRKFWDETLQGKDDRLYRRAPNDPEDFLGVLDQSRAPNERAKSLLDGLMFKVKGNHDDRTIALLINDDMSDEIPPEPTPENQEVDAQMTNESAPIETPTDAGNLAAHDTATGLDATQEPSVEDATTEPREPAQTGANQTGDAQVTNESASDATPESNAVVETPTDAENGATTETAQNNDGQTPVEVSPAASAQSPAPVSQDSAEGSEAPSSPTAEPQQS